MADLSKLSDEELLKMRGGGGVDLSKVSTEDLMRMRAAPQGDLDGVDKAIQRGIISGGKNIALGALKGAADIGTTLMRPIDFLKDKITGQGETTLGSLVTGKQPLTSNEERRASIASFFKDNAEPDSLAFKGGELAADVAGTAGVGGVLAKGARAVGSAVPLLAEYAPKLAAALESGGFKLGSEAATTAAGKAADWATRVAGGSATGAASAGLIDPSSAGAGAAIGGAFPVAVKAAGAAGSAIASKVSPDVQALYEKAKTLGIDIPADRIANSKPLNAVASSLNYIPFSGRSATEEKMVSQMNRALSRTFGQDSDNVTQALRKAQTALGDKFEITLKSNAVKADDALVSDLVANIQTANKELGKDGARIMGNMADEIMSKIGPSGEIDGQAAYNIKKALDRIGNRNSEEAYYAREMKKSLMAALNRSLGEEEAAAFAKVRQQYGNMLDLEGLAQNGAEGGISVARLANMKDINNRELQDLADIAAQFIRSRESPHGAAQRVVLGSLAAGGGAATGTLPLVAGGMVAGRAANTALNSMPLKSLLLNQEAVGRGADRIGANELLRSLMYTPANRASP